MQSYYLFSSGTLFRKDNSIRIQRDDGEYKDLKIEVTRDIYLFGEITLNSKCLNYLSQNRIPVHLFTVFIRVLFILEKQMCLELCWSTRLWLLRINILGLD